MTDVVDVIVDCHAYPWHEENAEYPECGPENLVRMAEQYGVVIEFLPDDEWSRWAWMYRITGPRPHIVRMLAEEYCGGVGDGDRSAVTIAEEMVAGSLGEVL